jgi:hypothetical protein
MSSSIFNFNYFRKFNLLSRTIIIWFSLIFLSFICLTIFASICIIHYYPHKISNNYRKQAINALSNNTIILLLGASHFFSDVDPSILSVPAVTLSAGSLNYATQFAILKKNIHKTPKLKLCLLELGRIPYTINTLHNRRHRFKGDFSDLIDLGLTYWDIPDFHPLLATWFWFKDLKFISPIIKGPKFNLPSPVNTSAIKSSRKINQQIKTIKKPGFFTTTRTLHQYYKIPKSNVKKRKPSIYNKTELNRKALIQMIIFLEDKGVRILFIRFPRFRPNAKGLEKIIETTKKVSRYPICIYDYEKDNRFTESDYKDPNHLNFYGAQKFTKILNKQILSFVKQHNIQL